MGVKNGINALYGKKNFIGAVAPPFAVVNDSEMLATLSARDKRAGYVEAVKVALIRNREFFETIEQEAGALAIVRAGGHAAADPPVRGLHLDHIATSGDPFEFGSARPLDFGHWSAHKLEQLSDYKNPPRRSGGHRRGAGRGVFAPAGFPAGGGVRSNVLKLLEALGFPSFVLRRAVARHDSKQLLQFSSTAWSEFQEDLGGQLAITLLRDIGLGFEVHEMDLPKVVAAIHELKERHGQRAKTIRST